MVKYAINKDKLEKKGEQTLWTSKNGMLVSGVVGSTMKGFMKKNVAKVLAAKGRELKYFIETGRPRPDKLAKMARVEGKELFVIELCVQLARNGCKGRIGQRS